MLIVPSRMPRLHMIIAVDKAALKITFCPKFNDDKLVCVFKAAPSYSEKRGTGCCDQPFNDRNL